MFWDIFVELCAEKSTTPNAVAKKLGLSSGSVTSWKNGAIPRDTTLNKIAKYFGVTPEYLLGIKSIDLQHFAEPTSVDVAVEKFAASIQDAVRAAEEKKAPVHAGEAGRSRQEPAQGRLGRAGTVRGVFSKQAEMRTT